MLAGENDNQFRGHRDGNTAALAELLAKTLESEPLDQPVALSPQEDLAKLAQEDLTLDGGGKPV